jgi:uncharacterized protein (DUF2267 family)
MDFRRIIAGVGQHAHLPEPARTLAALSAFFVTLAERLEGRAAFSLSADLPRELANFLLSPPRAHGETFSMSEFYFRMSQRERVSVEMATRHARIIGAVVGASLSAAALQRWCEALPSELSWLLQPLPAEVERAPLGTKGRTRRQQS